MEDGFLKSQGMPSPTVLNCVDVLLCWALPLRCFEFPFLQVSSLKTFFLALLSFYFIHFLKAFCYVLVLL